MKRRTKRGAEQWEKLVREQAQSGLSAKGFCDRELIGLSSFHQWRRRLSSGACGEAGRSDALFIDMGRITGDGAGESGTRPGSGPGPGPGPGLELTLDLGSGIKLTLRRG